MKAFFAVLIVGLLAWKLSPDFQSWVGATLSQAKASLPIGASRAAAPPGFRCDGRKYCSQMTSCAEATTFLNHCPGMHMDGDNDGVPCERQWCE
ncbi:excalibur calcium-binding domain-containing protein [Pseudomonas sp. MYb60]|uniref:excalibur calcium-binding domain-containing protein n=1 Tax=Pseudomonas TaxID=286 RepID=UPI000CFD799F|nr:excalibur calcium-binding domain-containing protein [Pseudomonas sp. MYb60]PQZ91419.1 calcium-binding protein [Pseudomonas trivialis]PRB27089.1 calcium-binding protein [Pseudomonas sp. MYb60]